MKKVVAFAMSAVLMGCSQHQDEKATSATKQDDAIQAAVSGVETKEDREAAEKALRAITDLQRKRAEAAANVRSEAANN